MNRRDTTDVVLRTVAGALVLAGGVVHFKLWIDDVYPDKVATSFLLNAIGSAAAAVALVLWRHWLPIAGALVLTDATLLSFGLSRTDGGIPLLDFAERGWSPSPEAALALAFELAAALVLLAALGFWRFSALRAPRAPARPS